jgi:hypothetical protein
MGRHLQYRIASVAIAKDRGDQWVEVTVVLLFKIIHAPRLERGVA